VARDADARLKWPNDVVVDGDPPRKLAGVLAESFLDATGLAVVVGAGVNVNWPDPLPRELAELAIPATALNLELGAPVDREDLLVSVLRGFEHGCALHASPEGRATLLAEARELMVTLGQRVRADLGERQLEGRAVDLGAHGELVVVDDDGARHTVVAGDVIQLRPATDPDRGT